MKNKQYIFWIVLAIIIIVGVLAAIFWPKQSSGQAYLYVSETCLHCKNVKDFIKANDIESKYQFEMKEVSKNAENAQELGDKADKCGISRNELGVPLLWDNGKCYVGEEEIINFLKTKTEITQ